MNKITLKKLFSNENIVKIIKDILNTLNILIRIEDNDGILIFGEKDESLLSDKCDIKVGNDVIGIIKGNKDLSCICSLITNLAYNELIKENLSYNVFLRNKIINILYSISELIATTTDINDAGYLFANEVMKYFEASITYIALIDKKTNDLKIVFQHFEKFGQMLSKNLSKNFIDPNNIISQNVIEKKRGIIINNVSQNKRLVKIKSLISSFICVPIIYKNKSIGVLVVGNDSPVTYKITDLKLCSALGFQCGIYLENIRLHDNVKNNFFNTIKVIAEINEMKKNCIGNTNKRVSKFSMDIAKALTLSEVEQGQVKLASMIYDIGKLSISDEILNKKGQLSIEEQNKLKQHPIKGAEIINQIESISNLAPIIRAHYERFDGKGYPDKLKGNEIPLISRIITAADAFDSIISQESYNPNANIELAFEELKKNKELKYDPEIVDTFLKLLKGKTPKEISDYIFKY